MSDRIIIVKPVYTGFYRKSSLNRFDLRNASGIKRSKICIVHAYDVSTDEIFLNLRCGFAVSDPKPKFSLVAFFKEKNHGGAMFTVISEDRPPRTLNLLCPDRCPL